MRLFHCNAYHGISRHNTDVFYIYRIPDFFTLILIMFAIDTDKKTNRNKSIIGRSSAVDSWGGPKIGVLVLIQSRF